jgi:hypothetical protein
MVTVRGKTDARRLLRDDLDGDKLDGPLEKASQVARPTGEGAAGVVGDDSGGGIELDLDELAEAQHAIDTKYDELSSYLRLAEELSGPLSDGKGPVTGPMRAAFGLRGGEDSGGVQAALRSYLDELDGLRAAIRQVAASHQSQDEQAAAEVQPR